ncbi:MAG TPA: hypothetical protein VNP02_18180 [Gammaproteobacteria bacterium]|nr:hypothetical protein [Gammaproteobacteria bacterium]
MSKRFALLLASLWLATNASAQAPAQTYRAAVVALTEDAALRQSFESELVALARSHSYDAVTSYDIASDVDNLDTDAFLKALSDRGVQAVLMVRPAAVGAGSSLEAVRNEVPSRTFTDMQKFAKRTSGSDANDLIAVVHLAIYTLTAKKPELVSSGAVWLDEPVTDRAEGIKRLQGLILQNVDAVRPSIRRHLGLPPLPQ